MERAAGLRSSRCGEWGGDDQEAASSLFSRGRSERGGWFVASIALVHDLAGHHRPLGRRVFSGGLSKRHALPRRPASQGFFGTIFPILRTCFTDRACSLALSRDFELFHPAVQRGEADAEQLGRLAFVVGSTAQHVLDV